MTCKITFAEWLTVWLFKYGARKLQQSICFNWDLISVNIFINATQNSSKVVNTVIKKTQNNVYGKRFDRNRKITRYDPILNSKACNNINNTSNSKAIKAKNGHIHIHKTEKKYSKQVHWPWLKGLVFGIASLSYLIFSRHRIANHSCLLVFWQLFGAAIHVLIFKFNEFCIFCPV